MVAIGGHSMEILAPPPPTTARTGSMWKLQGDSSVATERLSFLTYLSPDVSGDAAHFTLRRREI